MAEDLLGMLGMGGMGEAMPVAPVGEAMPMLPPGPDQQKNNASMFDLPVPGASMTADKGSMPFERPPEYTNVDDAMDFLFRSVTNTDNYKNVMRLMDAGVPISTIMQPILLHGASEGKWNTDLAMMLAEPLTVILHGLATSGGITPRVAPEKKDKSISTKSIRKVFKEKIEAKKEKKPEIPKEEIKETAGALLGRPTEVK